MRAADFSRRPKEPLREGGFETVPSREGLNTPRIVCASAQDLSFVRDGTVDIVVTDPPYFDNIAYSELAEFFLPWMKMVGLVNGADVRTRLSLESLVGRRNDAEATEHYVRGLSNAFRELARVLAPAGLIVFSFRHAVADAWYALATALAGAALTPTQFLPAPGEAGVGLHVHERTGLWDAVFTLRKSDRAAMDLLPIGDAGRSHVNSAVATWAKQLTRARLPFTDVDRLTLRRAGFVAVSLGLLGHRQVDAEAERTTPLKNLL
jgi:hypothetical protein